MLLQNLIETLAPLGDNAFFSFGIFFMFSFVVGVIAAMFGVGGGFFFTPFFHSVIGLPAIQAVATSTLQIPFLSASGSIAYLYEKKVEMTVAFWLLLGAIPSSQITVWLFSHLSQENNIFTDYFLLVSYTLLMGGLGMYGFFKKEKKTTIYQDKRDYISGNKISIFVTGLLFGLIAASLGIGGGFLAVPYFTHILKMPISKATATSLFAMFFISLIAGLQYWFYGHTQVSLAFLAAIGTMSGAQLGSRAAMRISSYVLKKTFSLLQIVVVVLYLLRYFKIF